MGACVGAVPGAGTSWPLLLQAPGAFISACPGNVLVWVHPLPGFRCLLGIKGFS